MEIYDVSFLQEALDDLEEIVLYIAADNPVAALSMRDKIIGKAKDLSKFPKRGRLVPDKKMSEAGYRMLVVKPYLVFYRILKNNVYIYRILHGASNYPALYEKISQMGGGEL
jgi:plasmid stabilization system protein ParE